MEVESSLGDLHRYFARYAPGHLKCVDIGHNDGTEDNMNRTLIFTLSKNYLKFMDMSLLIRFSYIHKSNPTYIKVRYSLFQ